MIVYAFMAGPTVSVGGLFMAGVVPGLLLVLGMLCLCSFIAARQLSADRRTVLVARASGMNSSAR